MLVQANHVSKKYKLGETIVDALLPISMTVDPQEFLAVAGSSGSGKTTLLNLIGGIDTPTTGEVYVGDVNLGKLSQDELSYFRAIKIGFIFQTFNLIPTLTAFENVEYPLMLLGIKNKNLVEEALRAVGLLQFQQHKPSELSGGQRQRVAIARAIVKKPIIILADEPTANLDKKNAHDILELMKNLNTTLGTTFIFSTHDPEVIRKASRVLDMESLLRPHEEKVVTQQEKILHAV